MPRSQLLQSSMNQHLRFEPIPFIDLAAQRRRLGKSIDEAVSRVLGHCQFINGPEVARLEAKVLDNHANREERARLGRLREQLPGDPGADADVLVRAINSKP